MTSPPLERYAWPLLPPSGVGEVVELGSEWRLEPSAGDEPIVCGRPPLRKIAPLRVAVTNAVRRTRFVRACKKERSHEVRAVHHLPPPPGSQAPLVGVLREQLLGGALVLLSSAPVETTLEAVGRAAGANNPPEDFHVPGDGGAVARLVTAGGARILRMARRGEAADPSPSADALETLAAAGLAAVPRLDARGVLGDISWTTESLLPGRRPAAITPQLREQLVDFCSRLPRSPGPPVAPGADLDVVERHFPERAPALAAVRRAIDERLPAGPAIARHGDFWAGNLLTTGNELTGVIDWAAWHPAGAPGTDLVHLLVAGGKKEARGELGEAWAARPWRGPDFATATSAYWDALGVDPTPETLDAVALAWWACWVAQSVTRHPGRARQARWVEGNVERVLSEIAS